MTQEEKLIEELDHILGAAIWPYSVEQKNFAVRKAANLLTTRLAELEKEMEALRNERLERFYIMVCNNGVCGSVEELIKEAQKRMEIFDIALTQFKSTNNAETGK